MLAPELFIKHALKVVSVQKIETVQSLWSGYGEIARYQVQRELPASTEQSSLNVILKAIHWSDIQAHPRGWQSDLSHQRKVHSYQVEAAWYQHWAPLCDDTERVPTLLAHWQQDGVMYLLLEDLDHSGYAERHSHLSIEQASVVLHWLASFHSRFLISHPDSEWPTGLWQQGTYWHLATRPDEWQIMEEGALKDAAKALDQALRQASYQTLVHGDAKVANFCFSEDNKRVAAVDFQYVGRGTGIQDVAYFLGSCLTESELEQHLDYLLDVYFTELSRCMIASGESPDLAEAVTQQWYHLFPIAWADFQRFLMGWCPTHHKNTLFSRKVTEQGVKMIR